MNLFKTGMDFQRLLAIYGYHFRKIAETHIL